ncbi:MAG TPA: SRPBCC family protein [Gaiellaceae bacterium]|nr:SRPBCC family protein [Gaiellaceae bacterium]
MPKVEQSIEIKVPVRAAYDQWTRFEEFPNFMNGVEEVRQLDDTHLHWVAEIGGTREEWDAEITEQHPDERIAWKAIGGKNNAGVVTFHGLDDHRCEIMLRLDWESEGMIEKLGSAIGQDDRQVKSDLQRFKEFVESRGSETDGWRGQVEQGVRR